MRVKEAPQRLFLASFDTCSTLCTQTYPWLMSLGLQREFQHSKDERSLSYSTAHVALLMQLEEELLGEDGADAAHWGLF
eukprot:scaffold61374_cov21-Tisochrysis_lutea.AAC.2